ncbi:uncharacterized protein LOC128277988 isoform X1 [Anopheles cruzii]|uniref:uncharacterized protein LOC128277988 isoform X1 n=1 Tax=Anopheles cruzii TaxID=68878 RepID=UPI0022EC81EE|nr:uncharacterized protein LOC128277988 isoform X1 [Anopheles cruzii]
MDPQSLHQREVLAGGMLQQQQEEMEEDEEEAALVANEHSHGEKRKHREMMDSESEEDDFAGFDEDAASENGRLCSPPSKSLSDALWTAMDKKMQEAENTEEDATDVLDEQNASKQDDMDNVNQSAMSLDASKLMIGKKKPFVPVNVHDAIYKVPFKYGWKRELVYRANMDGSSKDKGEVYYITPTGKKLRTRHCIVAALHDDLTLDNFTFTKEPVGGNPDEETIRSAKSYTNAPKRSVLGSQTVPGLEASPDLGKRVPKPKMPKGASPTPPSTYSKGANVLSSRVSPKSNSTSGGVAGSGSGAVAIGGSRNNYLIPGGIRKSNENVSTLEKSTKGKSRVECTIQCLLAMGMIPQLQCMVCFCMYHPECVFATTAEALARRFTCKSCTEESATAQVQHAQAYKKSFGMFGIIGNGNNNLGTAPNVASNGEGMLTLHGTAPKEKTKRSQPQQQSSGSAKLSIPTKQAAAITAVPTVPEKDIPPQDVVVIGGNEYVLVPKGKATNAKVKKLSKPANQSHPNPRNSDDARKTGTGTATGIVSNKHTNNSNSNERLSGDREPSAASVSGSTGTTNGRSSARDPSNFLSEVSAGYQALMQIFDYLKVQELLRACSVCRMWNHVGNHQRFWRTVRMKNSYVKDWAGMIAKLRQNGTQHLDLRKVLNAGSNDEMWQSFIEHIGQAKKIEKIDMCRCSSTVVGNLLRSNPNLRVVNALAIKNDPIDFVNFQYGKNLEELRLRSSVAVSVDGDLHQLGALRNLKHLSLMSIAKLGATSIEALGSLVLLESLELGECTEIGSNLATILPKLSVLKHLRLEKGQENFDMFIVLEGISKMSSLEQLDLINCDVKLGFDKHIVSCKNLSKLLLIPTYVSQSAATNQMILKGIMNMHSTLKAVVWVITEELLRVTELYIDTNVDDGGASNNLGEKIPILKPVPGSDEPASVVHQADVPDKVEIVPLTKLEHILERRVPNTKVQIRKVAFANTWKQTMVDVL